MRIYTNVVANEMIDGIDCVITWNSACAIYDLYMNDEWVAEDKNYDRLHRIMFAIR